MYGLIDSHFHLDMYKNYEDIFHYLEREKQYTLCMTNSPGIFLSCKDLFPNSKYVKFAIGFHPMNGELTLKNLKDFMYLLQTTNYVGEIGLDFIQKNGMAKEQQIVIFDEITSICSKNNKLMSVHIRGAEKEALQIISKHKPQKCILHWYTGSPTIQKEFIEIGCYFSVNANMLQNMEIVNAIPREKFLIESDGPYSKVDGKKYTPQLLLTEYQLIARAIKEPDLIKIVYSNFKRLLLI